MRLLFFLIALTAAFLLALSGCAMQEKHAPSPTAQKYGWTHRMGGGDRDEANAICADGSGNIYVAGYFKGTVNFADDWGESDTKVSAGPCDIFITKIGAVGNYIWTHRMGGESYDGAYAICADGSGNVYVTGYFGGTVNFAADWGGSDTKVSVGDYDTFVTKIGARGNYLWTHRMGGADSEAAFAICADGSGSIYVAGSFRGTVNFAADWGGTDTKVSAGSDDIFITKIDAGGNYLWTRSMGGGSGDSAHNICADRSDNIYVTGRFNGTVNFASDWGGTDTKVSAGSDDIFITKIDASGNYLWTRRIGGDNSDTSGAICAVGKGNVYMAGSFWSRTVNFAEDWGGTVTKDNTGSGDIFIAKIGDGGSSIWARRMGGRASDAAFAICADGSGNTYVVGDFQGTVNFANDWGGTDTRVSAGDDDIFITKIDANKNYLWTRRMGAGDRDVAVAICADGSGSVYVAGWFQGTVNFAADWGGTDTKVSAGSDDIFVTKIER